MMHLACQHVAISPSLDGETNQLPEKNGQLRLQDECIGELANILRETRNRIFQSNKITELTDKGDGHCGVPQRTRKGWQSGGSLQPAGQFLKEGGFRLRDWSLALRMPFWS
jgi:hypothetical protein